MFLNRNWLRVTLVVLAAVFTASAVPAQNGEQYDPVDNSMCTDCHDESPHGTDYWDDLEHSIHDGLECLDCHKDAGTDPHNFDEDYYPGCEGCRDCHEDASEQYQAHGRAARGTCADMPHCSDCHGDHDVLPSSVKRSKVHPVNLPHTCGECHENLDITTKYDILIDHPIQIYETSVHGQATKGGVYVAATCNDCHSTGGTAHKILSPGSIESSINHFNIPFTCGKCHKGIENDFWEGIHGKLVARGETDAPVCTDCHGEHGILSPDDPRSPVSGSKVAELTCSPCHESTVLNEKYGLKTDRLTTFIDSYHGLKSKAGDTHVANCASCHGVHRILPSTDSTSTVYPANLQHTCGECHPAISAKMAANPIHGVSGGGLRTPVADIVEKIYIIAIVVIIGLMALHWLIDLGRQLLNLFRSRPQVRRMRTGEVWQHMFLAVTFTVLVITGFALRFDQSWFAKLLFGWDHGFVIRGTVHRVAAVLFMLTVLWHVIYLSTLRGRQFFVDMMPLRTDFTFFFDRILYNFGRRKQTPQFERFSYVEKAEYWALVWGTVVMIITGLMLWFDNWIIQFLPKGVLDVALVIHYWEAWLATLAILVWHLYSTVFNPHVYPMNPSWLTGMMPEEMYKHEHPAHLEEARRDTDEMLKEHISRVADWESVDKRNPSSERRTTDSEDKS
jgi:cytochrome b subunit of formate dehydrogenase